MKAKEKQKGFSDIEMLKDIRDDAHEVGKDCKEAFKTERSVATGRLMNVSYNTAMRAIRDTKRYCVSGK